MSSFHFYRWNQFIVSPRLVHSIQETTPGNFLRRWTRVDGMADNADISQSQAANDDRLLSHVTLGRVKCKK